jgi:N6-adenosine-specific RNA methylase IME4
MPKKPTQKELVKQVFNTEKKYNVIVLDPPWKYNNCTRVGQAEQQYPVMDFVDLEKLPIKHLGEKDCALCMWVTNPMLKKGIEMMDAWKFKYKTVFIVWIKKQKHAPEKTITNGLSWYTRPGAELMLIGVRGTLKNIRGTSEDGSYKVSQVVEAPRREHSRKPDEAREAIDTFFRKGTTKIELFARSQWKDWDCWGNETDKFGKVEAVEPVNESVISIENKELQV